MHQNSYWTKLIYHVSAYVDYLVWKQDLKTLEILHVGLYKSLDRLCWKDSLWVEMIRMIHMLEIIIYNNEFSLKLKKIQYSYINQEVTCLKAMKITYNLKCTY